MTGDSVSRRTRVALVSVGLGRVQRGFERYIGDLFDVLGDDLDITLYQSAGAAGGRHRVPPFLAPATALARALPGRSFGATEYKRDCIAFAVALTVELHRRQFDVVHVIDPPLAIVLQRLWRFTRLRARLLFTEGSVMPPEDYPRVDHIHHVAEVTFREAVAHGVPHSHMTLVPCGLHTRRFRAGESREAVRDRLGVPERAVVVLVISAIAREHKRVDYVIEEVSRLKGPVVLWIDGHPEDPALAEFAREKLGPNCRITHVASHDVPELYAMADVLVHASLRESFGLAIVEAISSGLPVLVHDSPHFAWLVGDRDCLVDMRVPGRLAARLCDFVDRPEERRRGAEARAEAVRLRFDWASLKAEYVDMYARVAAQTERAR